MSGGHFLRAGSLLYTTAPIWVAALVSLVYAAFYLLLLRLFSTRGPGNRLAPHFPGVRIQAQEHDR